MRFRPTRTFAALTLVFGALAAAGAGAVRPEAVADEASLITPAWTPVGLGRQAVTVVVQLSGDPVTVQQETAGRKLSKSEREQAKGKLKGDQNALRGNIEKLGGTVIAGYQSAYNGVKVRIARDKAEQLATLPGVKAVHPLQVMRPDNVRGVPFIGAPGVWQNMALRGENIKVAIIDTGIDYTHANFGGPGTVAAYDAAHAAETAPADPLLFGPLAQRVKGGIDLVGDSYNADPDSPTYQPIPHPDPNPLDCNGHGSHVAGTAAGSGVTAAGATFYGPYNATTIGDGSGFIVGPGVAPKADLYAIRVFGCDGSTDVTVDAIEWAVDNDMDVINMSLGSSFGTNEDPSAEASTNAAKAGVVVVTSAGNSGASQYITGSPGTADGSIATAASDAVPLDSRRPHRDRPAQRDAAFAAGDQRQRISHPCADQRSAGRAPGRSGDDHRPSGSARLGGRIARLLAGCVHVQRYRPRQRPDRGREARRSVLASPRPFSGSRVALRPWSWPTTPWDFRRSKGRSASTRTRGHRSP